MSPTAELFFDALANADEHSAVELAVGRVEAGTPVEDLLLGLIAPAQERVGRLWHAGEWSVAREHAASSITERVIAAVGRRGKPADEFGHVVLACLDGEWHALPARIVGEVLRLHGWRVTFLGASVPAAHLITYLHGCGPDAVALSCTQSVHLPVAHRTIAAAQRTGTPVLAGGAGFGPDGRWARGLGADAYAATAPDAVAVLAAGRWADEPAAVGTGGAEYTGLRQRRLPLVQEAVIRLGTRSPYTGRPVGALDGDPGDDVAHVIDALAAALYVHDRDVFDGHIRWLDELLTARGVTADDAHTVLAVLAAGLHDFPLAQRYLRHGHTLLTGP